MITPKEEAGLHMAQPRRKTNTRCCHDRRTSTVMMILLQLCRRRAIEQASEGSGRMHSESDVSVSLFVASHERMRVWFVALISRPWSSTPVDQPRRDLCLPANPDASLVMSSLGVITTATSSLRLSHTSSVVSVEDLLLITSIFTTQHS